MIAAAKTFVYAANAKSGTISIYTLDRGSGALARASTTDTGAPVSPIALSPDRRFLYASLKSEPFAIATFAMDSRTGDLERLSTIPAPASLTYIVPDRNNRFLLAASYSGNIVCTFPIGPEGIVQAEPACILHPGRNPHCIRTDASNTFAFVPCLGSDQIAQFIFNPNTGSLTPNHPGLIATARQAGPRHLAVSPDNRHLYALTELSGVITTYALDREHGTLAEKHSVSFLPPDSPLPPGKYEPPLNAQGGENSPAPVVWGAEIRVTPDGRFVYASERTNSTITCLKADAATGRLDHVESVATEKQPRAFAIDPTGRHLVAAGEKSNHLSVYAIDQTTGRLSHTSRQPTGEKPGWVETVTFR